MEKGMKEGMQQGMHQGILSVAKKLLKANTSVGTIIEVTGLTQEEIELLGREN